MTQLSAQLAGQWAMVTNEVQYFPEKKNILYWTDYRTAKTGQKSLC
jgi:hypothetical protein